MVKQLQREGYSLVELLIAIAISAIVLTGVLALLGFGTRNMRLTQARVELQNQAKDAVNHVSAYVMEASRVTWKEEGDLLTVSRDKIGADHKVESTEQFFYWRSGEGIYFARSSEVDPAALPADRKHLLVDHITGFTCEVKTNGDTGREFLHVVMTLADEDIAEFTCEKDISMRNQ